MIEGASYPATSEQTYCPTWSNNPHDYHINNRSRVDPNIYIAGHVHKEQSFPWLYEAICDSDIAPS